MVNHRKGWRKIQDTRWFFHRDRIESTLENFVAHFELITYIIYVFQANWHFAEMIFHEGVNPPSDGAHSWRQRHDLSFSF